MLLLMPCHDNITLQPHLRFNHHPIQTPPFSKHAQAMLQMHHSIKPLLTTTPIVLARSISIGYDEIALMNATHGSRPVALGGVSKKTQNSKLQRVQC